MQRATFGLGESEELMTAIQFLLLEQYVVYGQQIYRPAGTAADMMPQVRSTVIGAKLAECSA